MATVLVVDDEPVILRLAESMLLSAGYQVVAAHGGTAAVLKMRQGRADVVLADVVMPGTSGPVCVERLTALEPGLPVILMSEFGQDQMRSYAYARGFQFVPKPLDLCELTEVLELVLAPELVPVEALA